MRCTMGESRLPSLALMHINYDLPVDMEDLSQRTLILFFFLIWKIIKLLE